MALWGEAACSTRAVPDRLFGPMRTFQSLRDSGLVPSYARFLIAFVSSARLKGTANVECVSIPIEAIDHE